MSVPEDVRCVRVMSVHEGSTDVLTQWKAREHLNDKREKFREFVEVNIYI